MPAKNDRVSEFADKELVYKPKYARMIGSVTAAILLKQAAFWFKLKRNQPFYKFKAPCKHKLYLEGDSWEEELGFSRAEFDCALSKIGTKITQSSGLNKGDILLMDTAFFDENGVMTNANRLIIYWTDADRVTWYILNENLLEDALDKLDLKRESSFSRKSGNPALAGKAENSLYPPSESITEKTTEREETTSHAEKSNVDFPRAEQQSLLNPVETPQGQNGNGSHKGKKGSEPKTARPKKPSNPNTQPILKAYQEAYEEHTGFAYTFPGADSKAAKTLAEAGYTPEQVAIAYRYLCQDKWWSTRNNISLMNVSTEIGGILKKLGYSRNGATQEQPRYLTADNLYS